jgi:hypothetical protein
MSPAPQNIVNTTELITTVIMAKASRLLNLKKITGKVFKKTGKFIMFA